MKIILNDIELEDLLIGIRAVRWLAERPEQRDAIISYGQQPPIDIFVKRTKSGISARQVSRVKND